MSTDPLGHANVLTAIRRRVSRDRLVNEAKGLIAIPSPTGDAGRVADHLASRLVADGFTVERPSGGHAAAPAVVVRLDSGVPGPTLQFDGHLDTVHLPFVPPRLEDRGGGEQLLRGSGASDMKGGLAAAIEALRILRELGLPRRGGVLFVAHDLHEAPWGHGEQLDALIREGIHGDAVLIPEPLSAPLPVAGRGAAVWRATVRRAGEPVHEVMRDPAAPWVIAAAADLALALRSHDARLSADVHPIAGSASCFVGQMHAGEIYNQLPVEAFLQGTRRWPPGADPSGIEAGLREIADEVATRHGVTIDLDLRVIRGAFALEEDSPLVRAFDASMRDVSGRILDRGPKPFVDDGNSFSSIAGVPAITHGPRAGGQHTVEEWADVDDLVRVAVLYALTAARWAEA